MAKSVRVGALILTFLVVLCSKCCLGEFEFGPFKLCSKFIVNYNTVGLRNGPIGQWPIAIEGNRDGHVQESDWG